ncbi:saccharopine dehydrogenase NADP-binding domain-containing protein, partial [Mammaliicoccus vitulinus]
MKLLITGANGHSGKLFLKNLSTTNIKKYEEIHIIVRNDDLDRFIEESGLNIIKHKGDLTDVKFLTEVTRNIDTILHIAGVQMSRNLFEAAINNKVNWIIAVHTTGRYSQFKMASEEYINIEDNLLTLRDEINITI